MRPVRLVGLYLTFVFLGGALLAPWLYKLVQLAGDYLPGLQSVTAKPFPQYLGRSLLMVALLGLVPFLRAANFWSWRDIGLPKRSEGLRELGLGFALGLSSLACLVAIVLATGARRFATDFTALGLLKRLLTASLAAACVAPVEELFFRGCLFGTLRRALNWHSALMLSSCIYALLHFLNLSGPVVRVDAASGLLVLVGMMEALSDVAKLMPGLLNLILVGMILGLAYQRLGSLHFSIGLHAGWIFWLKTYVFLTDEGPFGANSWFGTNKLIDGWLASAMLALVLTLVSWTLSPRDAELGWKERRNFC